VSPVDVVIRWREPADDATGRPGAYDGNSAVWQWPAGMPLPEVGDEVALQSASPLPGPVRVIARRWIGGVLMARDFPLGVLLELRTEVLR
jgi:hypothetical protein